MPEFMLEGYVEVRCRRCQEHLSAYVTSSRYSIKVAIQPHTCPDKKEDEEGEE